MCVNLVDLHIKTEYNRTNLGVGERWVPCCAWCPSINHQDRRNVVICAAWAGLPTGHWMRLRRHLKRGAR